MNTTNINNFNDLPTLLNLGGHMTTTKNTSPDTTKQNKVEAEPVAPVPDTAKGAVMSAAPKTISTKQKVKPRPALKPTFQSREPGTQVDDKPKSFLRRLSKSANELHAMINKTPVKFHRS